MTIFDQIYEDEEAEIAEWYLGEYDNGEDGCPNCGRHRLCKTANDKHRCEKCNWIPEDGKYCHLAL